LQDGLGLDDERNRAILIIQQVGLHDDRALSDVDGRGGRSHET
jgi:hypothetical protein